MAGLLATKPDPLQLTPASGAERRRISVAILMTDHTDRRFSGPVLAELKAWANPAATSFDKLSVVACRALECSSTAQQPAGHDPRTIRPTWRAWARMQGEHLGQETTEEDQVAIKVIVELRAKPGRRGELEHLLEGLVATQGPSQQGFLGSSRYEVPGDPDVLIEIAEWESAEARDAHLEEAAATGAYAPLIGLLAAPFRATVIKQRP